MYLVGIFKFLVILTLITFVTTGILLRGLALYRYSDNYFGYIPIFGKYGFFLSSIFKSKDYFFHPFWESFKFLATNFTLIFLIYFKHYFNVNYFYDFLVETTINCCMIFTAIIILFQILKINSSIIYNYNDKKPNFFYALVCTLFPVASYIWIFINTDEEYEKVKVFDLKNDDDETNEDE